MAFGANNVDQLLGASFGQRLSLATCFGTRSVLTVGLPKRQLNGDFLRSVLLVEQAIFTCVDSVLLMAE